MKFTYNNLHFSCIQADYPNFCSATILRNFLAYYIQPSLKEAKINPTEFLNEILCRLDNDASTLYMADVIKGPAGHYIFPLFEDGKLYGEWRCQKSEPYYNINSGHMVQHLVFYWTGEMGIEDADDFNADDAFDDED